MFAFLSSNILMIIVVVTVISGFAAIGILMAVKIDPTIVKKSTRTPPTTERPAMTSADRVVRQLRKMDFNIFMLGILNLFVLIFIWWNLSEMNSRMDRAESKAEQAVREFNRRLP
jgi:type III secretory pathway component EscU